MVMHEVWKRGDSGPELQTNEGERVKSNEVALSLSGYVNTKLLELEEVLLDPGRNLAWRSTTIHGFGYLRPPVVFKHVSKILYPEMLHACK